MKINMIIKIFVFFLILNHLNTNGQNFNNHEKLCPTKSFPDLFRKKDSIKPINPKQSNLFLVIPLIGSQPATGFFMEWGCNIHSKGNSLPINILL